MTPDEATKLAADLTERESCYICRALPDNTVACTFNLMFTRAIILGVSEYGFRRRFCFEDRDLAMQRFLELSSETDEPAGYIARRP